MRAIRLMAALLAAAAFASGCGSDDDEPTPGAEVTVMTRNLYLGAPIEPVFTLVTLPELMAGVLELWNAAEASDIPARAKAIAAEIAATQPHLVGLQEVTLWRTGPADGLPPPLGGGTAAETIRYDFLQLILNELAARGFIYDAVAMSTNFDAELTAGDGTPATSLDVRMTDRDVILARSGVDVREVGDGRFDAKVQFTLAGLPVSIPRGWTSAVADFSGRSLRFVNSHLEIGTPAIPFAAVQGLQAGELVQVLGASSVPTILVGDFNSNALPGAADTTSYATLTSAGFVDLWSVLRGSEPGLTCCQDPGLRNEKSSLVARIDLVLYRGDFTPVAVDVVGETTADRTANGLWPSDHAGVVGTLRH